MGLENVNLLGAVAGAVAAMAIGSLWYSPWFFGNQWQELVGQPPDEMGSALPSMLIAAVLFLVMGIGMSWVIPNGASIGIGLMWGFLAFWAFLLPATVINGIFERRPWALMAIFLGYLLVSSMVMAAIITFLGA